MEGDSRDYLRHDKWLISIHALPVEGDNGYLALAYDVVISIHALPVEGD